MCGVGSGCKQRAGRRTRVCLCFRNAGSLPCSPQRRRSGDGAPESIVAPARASSPERLLPSAMALGRQRLGRDARATALGRQMGEGARVTALWRQRLGDDAWPTAPPWCSGKDARAEGSGVRVKAAKRSGFHRQLWAGQRFAFKGRRSAFPGLRPWTSLTDLCPLPPLQL